MSVGLFLGLLPAYGLHLPLVVLVCLPFSLDAPLAYLAANISIPPMMPLILFTEVELGSWLLQGAFLPLKIGAIKAEGAAAFGAALVVGALAVATVTGALGGGVTYAAVSFAAKRRGGKEGLPPGAP